MTFEHLTAGLERLKLTLELDEIKALVQLYDITLDGPSTPTLTHTPPHTHT